MADTSVEQLHIDVHIHFSRLMLELEAMPPVMVNIGTIPGHIAGKKLTGTELVAHALGWTQLGIQWCQFVHTACCQQELTGPKEGFTWKELKPLTLWMYEQYPEFNFKGICHKFRVAHQELVECIIQLQDERLKKPVTKNSQNLAELVLEHVIALYGGDLLRLRVWKKGLGWI